MDEPHLIAALRYVALRKAETIGRPIGAPDWIVAMEAQTGKTLTPRRCGPAPRDASLGVK